MKLIDMVDKHLENPCHIHDEVHKGYYHPSSMSCVIKNDYGEEQIIGDCLRSVYWGMKGVKESNPMKARGKRICGVGKLVEKFEIEQYKEMGIWRANNVKFVNPVYNVSGEADAVIWDESSKSLRGVEIKSGYDYKFRAEVIGSATRRGRPKWDQLLQTMFYVDYFKFPFIMVYIDRGNAARAEYEITLNRDGTPNIDGKKVENGLSIPRTMSRVRELEECVKDGVIPKRDFQIKYNKDRIKLLRDSRRLTKKESEEFDKNGDVDVGDWECSYCPFKDYCWKEGK